MPCSNPEHNHSWPAEGTLVIEKCERFCAYCTEPRHQNHQWKFAWFLRRHVRTVHCKPNCDYEDVTVSNAWTGMPEPTQPRMPAIKTHKKKNNKKKMSAGNTPMKKTPSPKKKRSPKSTKSKNLPRSGGKFLPSYSPTVTPDRPRMGGKSLPTGEALTQALNDANVYYPTEGPRDSSDANIHCPTKGPRRISAADLAYIKLKADFICEIVELSDDFLERGLSLIDVCNTLVREGERLANDATFGIEDEEGSVNGYAYEGENGYGAEYDHDDEVTDASESDDQASEYEGDESPGRGGYFVDQGDEDMYPAEESDEDDLSQAEDGDEYEDHNDEDFMYNGECSEGEDVVEEEWEQFPPEELNDEVSTEPTKEVFMPAPTFDFSTEDSSIQTTFTAPEQNNNHDNDFAAEMAKEHSGFAALEQGNSATSNEQSLFTGFELINNVTDGHGSTSCKELFQDNFGFVDCNGNLDFGEFFNEAYQDYDKVVED